jgi:hypothetical protein
VLVTAMVYVPAGVPLLPPPLLIVLPPPQATSKTKPASSTRASATARVPFLFCTEPKRTPAATSPITVTKPHKTVQNEYWSARRLLLVPSCSLSTLRRSPELWNSG